MTGIITSPAMSWNAHASATGRSVLVCTLHLFAYKIVKYTNKNPPSTNLILYTFQGKMPKIQNNKKVDQLLNPTAYHVNTGFEKQKNNK